MRNLIITGITLFVICGMLFGQSASSETDVKKELDKFLELCEKVEYSAIAESIVYSGKDEARYLKDTYNYTERSEATAVKRVAKKVKAFLDLSDSRTFGIYEESESNGILEKKQEVIFKNGEQEIVKTFIFINLDEQLLLLDVQ